MNKLKRRVKWVFCCCLLMVLTLALCFHFFHPEIQVLDNAHRLVRIVNTNTAKHANASRVHKAHPKGGVADVHVPSLAARISMKVEDKLRALNFSNLGYWEEKNEVLEKLIKDVEKKITLSENPPWKMAANWVTSDQVYPNDAPELGAVLHAMATARIRIADVGRKGTQLKMFLVLESNQKALFKPKRFSRDHIITGPPYAGADRHNGEIASFHLSRILDMRRVPLIVGREINLVADVMPVATEPLLKTFFQKGNSTCFYGRCYYCRPSDPVCGNGSKLEGALVLWLPERMVLKKYRNPWQRTYKDNVFARWETDVKYCDRVQQIPVYRHGRRLLDLIDAAIFDYLIGNADRHHYEVFQDYEDSMVLLLDNGKSFGNPYWDELTVLAPLYQCCRVRKSTVSRLRMFLGSLGNSLKDLLASDPLSPLLSRPHLEALDRRLRTIMAVIEVCCDEKGSENVLVDTT